MWELSVTQLTLVTFLTHDLFTTRTAARVDVTLLRDGTQHATAARLRTENTSRDQSPYTVTAGGMKRAGVSGERERQTDERYLTARGDVMTPVVGCTFVTSLSHSVGWTDTLTCVCIAVVSHMSTLAR